MRSMYLVDCGAITAIGHDAMRTVASLRAGIEGFEDLPFLGVAGYGLKGARIHGYAEGLLGYPRYEALAMRALRPIIERIPAAERRLATVIVGLPHRDRPGVPIGLGKSLCTALARRLELDPARVMSMEEGRTSVFAGLTHPGFLEDPRSYPIIGGVDVLTDPAALAGLSERGDLKELWDGSFAGEAAAFVRLSSRRLPGYWGRPASRIAGLGIGIEKATGTSDDPIVGKGLAQALRSAAADANITDADVGLRLNDLSGSRAGFEDEAAAFTRFYRTAGERVIDIWHLGSYVGETGAAAGGLALIWASAALELGFAPPGPIMMTCSEATRRTAVVLVPPSEGQPTPGHARGRVSRTRIELNPRPIIEEVAEPDPGLVVAELDDARRDLAILGGEDLAGLLLVREGHLADTSAPWADIVGYEARMLAALDALAWTRDAADSLALERLESDDIEEVAAAILVLGSGHVSDETWQAMAMSFRPDDDQRALAVARYLALCPSPEIEKHLAGSLSTGADASLIVGLLAALASKGALAERNLAPLLDAGRTDLLPGMLFAVGRAGLAPAMRSIDALCRTAPEAVRPADLLAYVQFGTPALPFFPIERFVEEAPLVAALASLRLGHSFLDSVPKDAELTPDLAHAMGWAGEPAAIPRLVSLLEADDELADAAAHALNLLLGTDRIEELEITDESDEEIQTTTSVTRLTRDREHWIAAWRDLGSPDTYRLRHGRKWDPRAAFGHLQRERPCALERAIACREYAVCHGQAFPVDPWHLVATQQETLRKVTTR